MVKRIRIALFISIIIVGFSSLLSLGQTISNWKAITDVYLVKHSGQGFNDQVGELNKIVDENIIISLRITGILILSFIFLFVFYHTLNNIVINRISKNSA